MSVCDSVRFARKAAIPDDDHKKVLPYLELSLESRLGFWLTWPSLVSEAYMDEQSHTH